MKKILRASGKHFWNGATICMTWFAKCKTNCKGAFLKWSCFHVVVANEPTKWAIPAFVVRLFLIFQHVITWFAWYLVAMGVKLQHGPYVLLGFFISGLWMHEFSCWCSWDYDNIVWKPFLSQANEEDLTEEYREERDNLIERLRTTLKPKEKNGLFAPWRRNLLSDFCPSPQGDPSLGQN